MVFDQEYPNKPRLQQIVMPKQISNLTVKHFVQGWGNIDEKEF